MILVQRNCLKHISFWGQINLRRADRPSKEKSLPGGFQVACECICRCPDAATEDIWNNLKTGLLKTTEKVCGTTRPLRWRRETWWWNEHVGEVITAERQAFKAWKTAKGTRASYHAANSIASTSCSPRS